MKKASVFLMFMLICINVMSQTIENKHKIDSLKKVISSVKVDTAKVWSLIALGNEIEGPEPDQAYKYYKEAEAISRKIKYPLGIVKAISNFTYILDIKGKSVESKPYYEEALALTIKHKMGSLLQAKQYANLGTWYYRNEFMLDCVKNYKKAWELADIANNKDLSIQLKANTATVFEKLRRYNDAIKLCDEVIAYAKNKKDFANEFNMIQCCHTKGNCLHDQDKYHEAIASYLESAKYSEKSQNLETLASSYTNLAASYNRIDNTELSFKYAQKGLQIAKKLDDVLSIRTAYHAIGNYFFFKDQQDSAKKYFDLTLKLYDDNDIIDQKYEIIASLADWHLRNGNFKMYKKLAIKADSLEIQAHGDKVMQNTQELEVKYETEKKQNQILKLQYEKQRQNNLIYSLIAGLLVVSLVGFIGYRNINYRRKLAEKEILGFQKEKQLTATESIIKGQEEERSRLAKDLHDGLGGILSSLKYSLTSMTGNFILTENSGKTFTKALETLETAISEMRRVAHSMMPEALLKFGLNDAILNFCEGINQHGKLQINFQAYGLENRLEQSVEITIFRIVQELLNNAMKHSKATKVLVQLTKTNETLVLTVEDNGKGFDKKLLEHNKGAGISNIESRVSYLNGQIEIDSNAVTGTSIIIEIPIKKV
jgi:two-component system, NarL family, sensor kinase